MLIHGFTSSPRRPRTRHARMAALAAIALVLSATSCAGHSAGTATPGTSAASATGIVGQVTVTTAAGDPDAPALRIRGAALYPGAPHGGEELRMIVTNDSAAPEHLYAITTAHAANVELFSAPATPDAQPQPAPSTGIALAPGASIAFGPGGPRILLTAPVGLAPGRPVALTLAFALAGLVPLSASPVRASSDNADTPTR